jgi:hypothetical protein
MNNPTARKTVFFAVLALACVARIALSYQLGYWFISSAIYDDALFVAWADLPAHFTQPDYLSLVKTLSYPVFLATGDALGLPYTVSIALLWILAATLVTLALRKLTGDRWYLALIFILVLFIPTAFDVSTGTRLYRSAIIAPCALITLSLLLGALFNTTGNARLRANIPWLLGAGLATTFTYYIKENGIWLMPVFLLCIAAIVVIEARRRLPADKNGFAKAALVALIPIIIFAGLTGAYKTVNHHYFGVWDTNTRTAGALGTFVSDLYSIDSPNRDVTGTWVPLDAIEKACAASPTLRQHPQLLEALASMSDRMPGDHIGWRLRDALQETGLWTSEAAMSAMFTQVNSELDTAFANGTLAKDPRLKVSSGAVGRTPGEIAQLAPLIADEIVVNIGFVGYTPAGHQPDEHYPQAIEQCIRVANQEPVYGSGASVPIVSMIMRAYKVLGPLLFALACLGAILSIIRAVRNRSTRDLPALLCMAALFATVLLICFGVAWFSQWLGDVALWAKSYSTEAVPCLILFELLGCLALVEAFERRVHRPRPQTEHPHLGYNS